MRVVDLDAVARLLAALWQIIRVVAVAGILVCEMAVISWLFLAAIDGREAVKEKIEQLKERGSPSARSKASGFLRGRCCSCRGSATNPLCSTAIRRITTR